MFATEGTENTELKQKKRNGIMEEWNIGMMGPQNRMLKRIIPSFQYSNFPSFFSVVSVAKCI